MAVESVAGWPWNGWPDQRGITGRMGVEWVAEWAWNTHVSIASRPDQILPKAIAHSSVIADVVVRKFVDGRRTTDITDIQVVMLRLLRR